MWTSWWTSSWTNPLQGRCPAAYDTGPSRSERSPRGTVPRPMELHGHRALADHARRLYGRPWLSGEDWRVGHRWIEGTPANMTPRRRRPPDTPRRWSSSG